RRSCHDRCRVAGSGGVTVAVVEARTQDVRARCGEHDARTGNREAAVVTVLVYPRHGQDSGICRWVFNEGSRCRTYAVAYGGHDDDVMRDCILDHPPPTVIIQRVADRDRDHLCAVLGGPLNGRDDPGIVEATHTGADW